MKDSDCHRNVRGCRTDFPRVSGCAILVVRYRCRGKVTIPSEPSRGGFQYDSSDRHFARRGRPADPSRHRDDNASRVRRGDRRDCGQPRREDTGLRGGVVVDPRFGPRPRPHPQARGEPARCPECGRVLLLRRLGHRLGCPGRAHRPPGRRRHRRPRRGPPGPGLVEPGTGPHQGLRGTLEPHGDPGLAGERAVGPAASGRAGGPGGGAADVGVVTQSRTRC